MLNDNFAITILDEDLNERIIMGYRVLIMLSVEGGKVHMKSHSAFWMLTTIVIISYSFCDLNDEETTKIIHKEAVALTYRAITKRNPKFY